MHANCEWFFLMRVVIGVTIVTQLRYDAKMWESIQSQEKENLEGGGIWIGTFVKNANVTNTLQN